MIQQFFLINKNANHVIHIMSYVIQYSPSTGIWFVLYCENIFVKKAVKSGIRLQSDTLSFYQGRIQISFFQEWIRA